MDEERSAPVAYCHKCGSRAVADASFCHACGSKLATSPVAAKPTTDGNGTHAAAVAVQPVVPAAQEGAGIVEADFPRESQLAFDMPIRSAPTDSSATIRQARAGERVLVTRMVGGFAELDGGVKGYVAARAVGATAQVPESNRAEPAYSFPLSARLRFEAFILDAPRARDTVAGLKGEVMRRAMAGEVFRVTGVENGFARVHEGRRYGFVRGDALGLTLAGAPPPTVAEDARIATSFSRANDAWRRTGPDNRTLASAKTGAGQIGRVLFLLGGLGMTASPFLPWVSANFILTMTASLYDIGKLGGDYAPFTEVLIIGLATTSGGLLRNLRVLDLMPARVWGGVGATAGIIEVIYRYNQIRDSYGLVTLQLGFYVLAIASALVVVGIVLDGDE